MLKKQSSADRQSQIVDLGMKFIHFWLEHPDMTFEDELEGFMNKDDCDHICSGNCRRVGCNCECGEWHEVTD